MKRLRTIIVGTALSLTLLGSAASVGAAPEPFGRQCVSEIAHLHGGVGPHIQDMHPDSTVGAHLQMMRTGEHDCMHDMGMQE